MTGFLHKDAKRNKIIVIFSFLEMMQKIFHGCFRRNFLSFRWILFCYCQRYFLKLRLKGTSNSSRHQISVTRTVLLEWGVRGLSQLVQSASSCGQERNLRKWHVFKNSAETVKKRWKRRPVLATRKGTAYQTAGLV